mmetsp:Transcript_103411/g.292812  ORF Transcript_103411/g.292812 Transcript_103411/m.292812 type:complete len:230 (+) Transcript_103411:446-1135(+)
MIMPKRKDAASTPRKYSFLTPSTTSTLSILSNLLPKRLRTISEARRPISRPTSVNRPVTCVVRTTAPPQKVAMPFWSPQAAAAKNLAYRLWWLKVAAIRSTEMLSRPKSYSASPMCTVSLAMNRPQATLPATNESSTYRASMLPNPTFDRFPVWWLTNHSSSKYATELISPAEHASTAPTARTSRGRLKVGTASTSSTTEAASLSMASLICAYSFWPREIWLGELRTGG